MPPSASPPYFKQASRWLAACALIGVAVIAHAVTFEEIQRIKADVAVPRWRDAATVSRLLQAHPPDAATAAQWQLLDAQTDPQIGKTPLDQISAETNDAQRSVNASWLRWRVLSENADARYSFAYATQLAQMRNEQGDFDEEAILFYFHGKLALTLDGVRCTDRSKANHLTIWYTTQEASKQLERKVARMSPTDKSSAILEAIAIEDMLGERPAMRWLCPSRDPDYGSGTADALSRFLSDAEWRKKRTELLEQLARDAMRNL